MVGAEIFRSFSANELVLLPGSAESLGHPRRVLMAPRLTSHVRHCAKDLDMPVLDEQAFVFRTNGRVGPRAHSLKEFMAMLAALPREQIHGHLSRHDFSRWLNDVFRDHGVAGRVGALEDGAGTRDPRDIAADVAQSVRARYDTAPRLIAAR